MNCTEIRKKTVAYIDHELEFLEEREFRVHLARCPECREQVAEGLREADILRTCLRSGQAPGGFADRLFARMHSEASPVVVLPVKQTPAPVRWKRGAASLVGLAAGLLLLLGSGVAVIPGGTGPVNPYNPDLPAVKLTPTVSIQGISPTPALSLFVPDACPTPPARA